MKGKNIILIIIAIIIALIYITSSRSASAPSQTTAYVIANGNIFIKGAKLIDSLCFYIINVTIDGIVNIFNGIIG